MSRYFMGKYLTIYHVLKYICIYYKAYCTYQFKTISRSAEENAYIVCMYVYYYTV